MDQRISGLVHNRIFPYQPCNYRAAGKNGMFCKGQWQGGLLDNDTVLGTCMLNPADCGKVGVGEVGCTGGPKGKPRTSWLGGTAACSVLCMVMLFHHGLPPHLVFDFISGVFIVVCTLPSHLNLVLLRTLCKQPVVCNGQTLHYSAWHPAPANLPYSRYKDHPPSASLFHAHDCPLPCTPASLSPNSPARSAA